MCAHALSFRTHMVITEGEMMQTLSVSCGLTAHKQDRPHSPDAPGLCSRAGGADRPVVATRPSSSLKVVTDRAGILDELGKHFAIAEEATPMQLRGS